MAKTKAEIVEGIAKEADISQKQARAALDALTKMAYKNAREGFTIPGIGKLVVVDRKARWGRNPATGERIKIRAKKGLKFRVSKAAKDAVLPSRKKK